MIERTLLEVDQQKKAKNVISKSKFNVDEL